MEHWLLEEGCQEPTSSCPTPTPGLSVSFWLFPALQGGWALVWTVPWAVLGLFHSRWQVGEPRWGLGDRRALLNPLQWHHQAVPGCPGSGRQSPCRGERKGVVSPGVSVGESQEG